MTIKLRELSGTPPKGESAAKFVRDDKKVQRLGQGVQNGQ
jgi:hypothetical protein